MKKKFFYFILSTLSAFVFISINSNDSLATGSLAAASGATCKQADMYFCKGCTIGQGQSDYKQVNLCGRSSDPIRIPDVIED